MVDISRERDQPRVKIIPECFKKHGINEESSNAQTKKAGDHVETTQVFS